MESPLKAGTRTVSFLLLALILCCVVFITGCTDDYQSLPDSDQALATHISVLSIGRWADYAYALQPRFILSAEDARAAAIANTADVSNSLVDSLGVSSTIGYGSSPASTQPPQSSSAATQPSVPPTVAALSLPTVPVQVSPFLQYKAATALYQEVRLIDLYVRDAAIGGSYEPYVVRLQVTVMPGRRDTDLDADTLISFFLRHPKCGSSDLKIIPLLVTDEITAASEINSAQQLRALQLEIALAFKGIGASGDISGLNQKLHAILDNDFNSAYTVAQASENTLKVRFGSVPSGDGYKLLPQTHDVTVLLLVPRRELICHQARISACSLTTYVDPATGTSYRETQDQMMDKISQVIVDYRDFGAETNLCEGSLTRATRVAVSRVVPLFFRRAGALNYMAYAPSVLEELMNNDYKEFRCTMGKIKVIPPVVYPFLWTDLTDILSHSPYDTTRFTLGRLRSPEVLPHQNPILEDNGKDRTDVLVAVRNAESFWDGYLRAWLSVATKKGATPCRNIPALAHWVGLRGQFHLLFPSLKADTILEAETHPTTGPGTTKAACSDAIRPEIKLHLEFTPKCDTGWTPIRDYVSSNCVYVVTKKAAVMPTTNLISVPTQICLVSPQGGGTIELAIGACAQIDLSGGDISSASNQMGDVVQLTPGDAGVGWWQIPPGDYHIALTNLDARTPVVIQAENNVPTGGAGVQTITITVVPASTGRTPSSGGGGGGSAASGNGTAPSTVSATVDITHPTAPTPSAATPTH